MSSTISNPALYSGQYYQLPSQSSTSANTTNSSTASNTSNPTETLLQALDPTLNQNSLSSNPTDLVDLSPQAQSILSGLGSTSSATTGLSTSSSGSGFLLSTQQQQQITAIIAKYKDAPFTQATYNQIQSDLKTAGLSPDTLAAQDEARSFNPTQILVDALNGVDSSSDIINPSTANASEQSNANSYMQQIFNQWQSISTTAGSSGSSATSAASSSTTA